MKKAKKNTLPSRSHLARRIRFVSRCMCLGLLALAVIVINIVVFNRETYTKGVLANMLQNERTIEAPRGVIQDRNERTLATSLLAYDVILSPYDIVYHVTSDKTRQKIYDSLATQLALPAATIQSEVEERAEKETGNRYYLLAEHVESEKAEPLIGLPGVTIQKTYIRSYLNDELAAQVLGFYSKKGEGQYGVEEEYDAYLQGKSGRTFSQIQKYQIVTSELEEATPGATVTLTLDSTVQRYVEEAMKPYIKEWSPNNASCIVMKPKTGEILAMYSYPSYNPNNYNDLSEQIGAENWKKLSDEQKSKALLESWKNYAIQLNYEPGSTFKPLVVAMALEEGIISADETYHCPGYKNVSGQVIRCWKHEGHGLQTLSEALANSCNVALMDIGEKMDNDQFLAYVKRYGFGEKTGVELAGEEQGQLHTSLGPVEKATYTMGQTLTVTPIQLISAFSSVINGGYLMEPYVVSEIKSQNGEVLLSHEGTMRHQVISTDIADYVREALKKVVDEGTGDKAAVNGYSVGGKTGTGEKWIMKDGKMVRDKENYVLSFMGFAPVDDPEIVALVVFDNIPEGTGVPAKAFKDMMENIFPYLQIPTSKEETTDDNLAVTVPDVQNKTLYEAVATLKSKGLSYQVLGSGITVTKQYPSANREIAKGGSVKLYTTTQQPEQLKEVPSLIGNTIEEAKALVAGDFTIEGTGSGKITSQLPSAGSKIEAKNKIIVQTAE